ncbi:hypothetical protein RJ639_016687 [Escallonia herrerae]|uniref:SBP-type domain-containing protein n=1 Tax=Escallonia herrerae TaxID=1293975 RepID=A0AA89AMZ9_9ASTE|nr:hypothetical protein RJ639_016687 [Escallonia herrerae]
MGVLASPTITCQHSRTMFDSLDLIILKAKWHDQSIAPRRPREQDVQSVFLKGTLKSVATYRILGAQTEEVPETWDFKVLSEVTDEFIDLLINKENLLHILYPFSVKNSFMRSVSVMEWNAKTPSEWDWENLAMYGGRTIEIPKSVQLSSNEAKGDDAVENVQGYSSSSGDFCGTYLGHGSSSKNMVSASKSSSKEGTKTLGVTNDFSKGSIEEEEFSAADKDRVFPNTGASVGSGEAMIGLKLGRRTYFEDMCAGSTTKTTSLSVIPMLPSPTIKRLRASYQSAQAPHCQVEGCNLDLVSAKDYHRRHRICENHSKSPTVTVAGMERRFCQQCSRQLFGLWCKRFHDLSEFDDRKRSCRRRLSDHNARRRRPPSEAMHFRSTRMSSSFCDQRQRMNFLLNRVPIPLSNRTWERDCNSKVTLAGDRTMNTAKGGATDRKSNCPSDSMSSAISTLHSGDTNRVYSSSATPPHVFNYDASAIANLDVGPEIRRALSLLSTNSWAFSEPEPTSLDQLVHGSLITVAQPVMQSYAQSWAPASSVRVEQAPSHLQVHSLDTQDTESTRFQEFQLFRTPHESDSFFPNHIS